MMPGDEDEHPASSSAVVQVNRRPLKFVARVINSQSRMIAMTMRIIRM